MNTQKCADCVYYIRHYGLNDSRFYRLNCGHCTQRRIKNREPDHAACPAFAPGQSPEFDFADRDYLSKRLMDYVLHMNLLEEVLTKEQKEDP